MKNDIWFLLSGNQLGGAEKRCIKMAAAVTKRGWFSNTNILVNKEVYAKYLEDAQISQIIESNQFNFHFYEDHAPWYMKNRLQIYLSKNILKRRVPLFVKKLVQQYFNWHSVIRKLVSPSDVVHAVYGDPAQNGTIRFSIKQKNNCIVEITDPRTVYRKYDQYTYARGVHSPPNLTVLCVSRVVFDIYTDLVKLDSLKWNINYYKGPMLKQRTEGDNTSFQKENVIIFAHRFMPVKNSVILAQAVSKLIADGGLSGWKILFLGRGPDEAQLLEILDAHIDSGAVQVGWSTDLESELARSKIFVSIIGTGNIPSQSLFSAMDHANLLLLSDTGNTKEIVGTYDGVAYTELTVESIAASLVKLVDACNSNDYTEARQSVIASYENIHKNFNYFSVLEDIYL